MLAVCILIVYLQGLPRRTFLFVFIPVGWTFTIAFHFAKYCMLGSIVSFVNLKFNTYYLSHSLCAVYYYPCPSMPPLSSSSHIPRLCFKFIEIWESSGCLYSAILLRSRVLFSDIDARKMVLLWVSSHVSLSSYHFLLTRMPARVLTKWYTVARTLCFRWCFSGGDKG
jgi:hypothetical protein